MPPPLSLIAKVLDMSKADIYHYCSSKEDLFYKTHLDYLRKYFVPIIDEAEQLLCPPNECGSTGGYILIYL